MSALEQHLKAALVREQQRCSELEHANANLQVERDAADVLLGEAMERLLELERA